MHSKILFAKKEQLSSCGRKHTPTPTRVCVRTQRNYRKAHTNITYVI